MVFQAAGIAMLLLFYGCYFLKMFHQHQKGIKTDQIGKGKVGFVKAVELMMKAITCLVPFVEAVSIFYDTSLFTMPVRIAGALIGSLGVAVFAVSVFTMRDNWRAGVPIAEKTELVTKGIYSISRNPAFLGFDFMYIGIGMMFFNWVLFFVSCFAVVMLHLQIVNVEEEFLKESFGEEYSHYKKKVCRYLGRKR